MKIYGVITSNSLSIIADNSSTKDYENIQLLFLLISFDYLNWFECKYYIDKIHFVEKKYKFSE